MPLPTALHSHPDFSNTSSSSSRLPSLYSDLSRQRKSNPAGYRSNVQWWRDVITSVVKAGQQGDRWETEAGDAPEDAKGKAAATAKKDRLVFHADEGLRQRWTLNSVGRPLGLGTVISELKDSSHLVPLNSFLQSTQPFAGPASSQSWLALPSAGTVATFLVGKPLMWAAAQLGVGMGGDGDEDQDEAAWKRGMGQWVVWDNVDEAARHVLEQHFSSPRLSALDSLFTLRTFKQKFLCTLWQDKEAATDESILTDQDVQILIRHLVRDRKVAMIDKEAGLWWRKQASTPVQVIKLAASPDAQPLPLTEQDRSVAQLQETHYSLEAQISEIEKRIEQRTAQIKTALKAGQKNQAMSYLRSRKQLEELLDRRTGSRETLAGVLIKIEQAEGDVEIMKAYELSDSTLKQLLANPLLQHDKVDSTVASLSDALADQAEIDEAVRLGGLDARSAAGEEDIDEEALAKELDALVLERKADDDAARVEREAAERRAEEEKRRKEEEARRIVEGQEKRRKEEEAKEAEKIRLDELARLQGERLAMEDRLKALRDAKPEERQPIAET